MDRSLLLALVLSACGNAGTEPTGIVADSSATQAPEGPQVVHLSDGGRMEGLLRDGRRTGTWSSYFPDGNLRSRSEYVEGLEEGPTVVYHPNGRTMYTGGYLHGLPFGEWVYFDPDGNELKRVEHDSTGVVVQ